MFRMTFESAFKLLTEMGEERGRVCVYIQRTGYHIEESHRDLAVCMQFQQGLLL